MWKISLVRYSSLYPSALLLSILIFPITDAFAQDRFEGTAVVRVDGGEYTVPIECDNAMRPELGFSTEPNRITRERTGRTNAINIRVRPSSEAEEIIVSLDRHVAWLPLPESESGTLSITMDLSPITIMKDGQPVLLTRDMWMNGERPEGLRGATVEAQCAVRDPDAPSYKKITG